MEPRHAVGALGLCAMAIGCGDTQLPRWEMTQSQAAIRAAEVQGAEGVSEAAYYLKLAREQELRAERLVDEGKLRRAAALLRQAKLDADLATAICEREQARAHLDQREEAVEAAQQKTKLSPHGAP